MNNNLSDVDSNNICRIIRDAFFGKSSSDENWHGCCSGWMEDFTKLNEKLTKHGYAIVKLPKTKI